MPATICGFRYVGDRGGSETRRTAGTFRANHRFTGAVFATLAGIAFSGPEPAVNIAIRVALPAQRGQRNLLATLATPAELGGAGPADLKAASGYRRSR